ncbi:MAG: TonB family protein [Okeania sp. SIO3I5]|uniref:TonB family protein n=1 Tax=Okeania sp. SIO3I5 TaxID=2607805 RepID=UPI0013B647BA|nr:TonB family protein [Okeania sp. SIO3I5]NEQ37443.1 TonB family protein [Okeania sp. SIO3I5]
MSDFSSLDLDQSFEKSSFTDSIRQPIWIALFSSVIIHAILGINLPKLSLFSEKAKLPPTVGLIELTPEQLELLPQPEEPEITFSTVPIPGNFSPIAPPTSAQVPTFSQSPASELPSIPVDPSDYNLPKLPPQDSNTSSSFSTPSVSRLPRNSAPTEFSYNYPSIPGRSLLPVTPVSPVPLPSRNRQPIDIFQVEPPPDPNQSQIDEYQIRKSLNLTDEVYDSGLSRRPTLEIDPNDQTSVAENSRKSYTANLTLPPQRYQDKVNNQNAVAVKENNTGTQPQKTPLPPDPTKKNRLSEAPIVRQLREGKTIQDLAEEAKQQQKTVFTAPSPTPTQKSQPETPPVVADPKPSPTPEKPKEFKGSLLAKLERSPQQKVTEVAPVPKPSPKTEEKLAAATLEETKAPAPEVKVTPAVAPTPKPSPSLQPLREFKGSLLQELQEKKRTNAPVNQESESREIALGAVGAYMQWAIELGVGEESLTQPKVISNVYPETACEEKLEGKATVGVLVNPDGSISKEPKLLLESGSPTLDRAALDAVNKESFDSNDDSKLYQYEFDFDSSSCGE